MTDEQINAAIAEAFLDKFRNEDDVWFFQYAKDCWSQCHNNSICNDLNAMHEAEKVLNKEQEKNYFANLRGVVGDLVWYRTVGKTYRATARERAEAFLKTLGLWKEVAE